MIIGRKVYQVNVFAGSPWKVACVKNSKGIQLMVPCEYYTAAMRIIGNRIS